MPRVFKRLDENIVKYCKFLYDKSETGDEIFRDVFQFRGWYLQTEFYVNSGTLPFFNISLPPMVDVQITWCDHKFSNHRTVDIRWEESNPYTRLYYGYNDERKHNEKICWLFKIVKRRLDFSLDDFDVLSSKFTELMIKMI